jgi:hypothetical protein
MTDKICSIGLVNNFQAAVGNKLDEQAFRSAAKAMGITARVIQPDGSERNNIAADGCNLDISVDAQDIIQEIVVAWPAAKP